jgi:hypothetical protein
LLPFNTSDSSQNSKTPPATFLEKYSADSGNFSEESAIATSAKSILFSEVLIMVPLI